MSEIKSQQFASVNNEQALAEAINYHRTGQLQDAERLYRAILQTQPKHPDANHNLGLIAVQRQQPIAALPHFKTALEANPAQWQFWQSYLDALLASDQAQIAKQILAIGMQRGLNTPVAHAMQQKIEIALMEHDNALPPAAIDQITALFNTGNYVGVEKRTRELLKNHPNSGFAWKALGTALKAQGKEAISALQQASRLLRHDAEVYYNLGIALTEIGQRDEAVVNYRRALEIAPNFVEAHVNLGSVLNDLGYFNDAAASYQQALKINPDFARAHNNLGNTLKALGRMDEAVISYRGALKIDPNFAEAHNNLGIALMNSFQYDEAMASIRRALEIRPNFADALINLSVAFRVQKQSSEAEASCRKALELFPSFPPAMILMAELMTDKGQFEDAEAMLRSAIAIEPDSPEAWARIASLRKMTKHDDVWLAAMQRIAGQPLAPRKEVEVRFALGKFHDDVKDFEQSFSNFRRANEILKIHEPKYDRQQQTRDVDLIIRSYDTAWVNMERPNANTSARPVFILGMPRSGTSLAEQILASHPAIFGAGELSFWYASSQSHDKSVSKGEMTESMLGKLADDYLQLLASYSLDALRVVDKMPANFLSVGLIRAAFPNARIIHMQRHPIDTCLSIYFQYFSSSHPYAYDLADLAHYYTQYRRVMAHWQTVLPSNTILDVPYEELVNDQEGWSRKMLGFIGMPWDERCIDFHQSNRTVGTASNWQVRQKINKTSVERWRNYEKFVEPLMSLIE